jgi:hypothetical protein
MCDARAAAIAATNLSAGADVLLGRQVVVQPEGRDKIGGVGAQELLRARAAGMHSGLLQRPHVPARRVRRSGLTRCAVFETRPRGCRARPCGGRCRARHSARDGQAVSMRSDHRDRSAHPLVDRAGVRSAEYGEHVWVARLGRLVHGAIAKLRSGVPWVSPAPPSPRTARTQSLASGSALRSMSVSTSRALPRSHARLSALCSYCDRPDQRGSAQVRSAAPGHLVASVHVGAGLDELPDQTHVDVVGPRERPKLRSATAR